MDPDNNDVKTTILYNIFLSIAVFLGGPPTKAIKDVQINPTVPVKLSMALYLYSRIDLTMATVSDTMNIVIHTFMLNCDMNVLKSKSSDKLSLVMGIYSPARYASIGCKKSM